MSRPRGKAWNQTRQHVFARDGYRCQIGGPKCTGIATEIDHIKPVKNGGGHEPNNLRAACLKCNRGRWVHDNYGWYGVDFFRA